VFTPTHFDIARADIDKLLDRLGKMENNNSMREAMASASLTDNAVDLILDKINEMQGKILSDIESKLSNYVTLPEFRELETKVDSNIRRTQHNETLLKNLTVIVEQNVEKIEALRKKLQKLNSESAMRDHNTSSMAQLTPVVEEPPIVVGEAGASQEAIEKLQKMIQRVEGGLIRRIVALEGFGGRINDLEDDLAAMKADLAKALAPKDPSITAEDVNRWNKNCKQTSELEKDLKSLQQALEAIDGPKIKADILQIFRVQSTFITSESLGPLREQIRRLEEGLQDV